MLPLRLSVLLIQLFSVLQPPLQLLDDYMLYADLGLMAVIYFSIAASPNKQDGPAVLGGMAVLVELVGIPIRVKYRVSGCDEVELAGVTRVGDEESASSLDRWGNFGADGETEGSGEGSRARTVGLEVGTGLYILEPAERMHPCIPNYYHPSFSEHYSLAIFRRLNSMHATTCFHRSANPPNVVDLPSSKCSAVIAAYDLGSVLRKSDGVRSVLTSNVYGLPAVILVNCQYCIFFLSDNPYVHVIVVL
jgi:hypothetical protein